MRNRTILVSLLALSLAAVSADAEFVAYREIFSHSGTNAPTFDNGLPTLANVSTIGWHVRRANSTGEVTNNANGSLINTVAAGAGIVQNLPAVNAGPQQSAQSSKGFAVIPGGGTPPDGVPDGVPYAFYTSEFTIHSASISSISWYQGNHSASDRLRVLVSVVGAGAFVSDTVFTNAPITSGGAFSTSGQFKSLDFSGAFWRTLDFNPVVGSNSGSFTLGSSSVALPAGQVDGFGLFLDNKSGNIRFDTYQINAVPEPSSLFALLVGTVAAARRRARR